MQTKNEYALLRELSKEKLPLAKTASEAFSTEVVPIVIMSECGEIGVDLITKGYGAEELMLLICPEEIE